jgi:hypothetical protein
VSSLLIVTSISLLFVIYNRHLLRKY